MRVSGGIYRGQKLEAPKGFDVRPATDKVRQAVFNSLLSRIHLDGISVLDTFCGTGSYGLEAISRGAAFSTFIDKNSKSIVACKNNIANLKVEAKTNVIQKDIFKLDELPENHQKAHLIFLDPPYRQGLLLPALDHLKNKGWLAKETICVLECEKDMDVPFGESKTYGDIKITFFALQN